MTHSHHAGRPKAPRASNNKIGNRLVALSSAAVLAVYTAGYMRTSAAAERLEASSVQRRAAAPVQAAAAARPATSEPVARTESRVPQAAAPFASVAGNEEADHVRVPRSLDKTAPARDITSAPVHDMKADAPVTAPRLRLQQVPLDHADPIPAAPSVAVAEHAATEPAAPAASAAVKYKDGTYLGWGTSRHGDIQASVVIEGGRIMSASIAQCLTRYSCSWVAELPGLVVKRQSPEVDFVSGATESTNAFYYAVVEALAKAK